MKQLCLFLRDKVLVERGLCSDRLAWLSRLVVPGALWGALDDEPLDVPADL